MTVLVDEETLRRIIREELGRERRPLSGPVSSYVPDRAQFRPSLFLSGLLHDIADVARAAGIKNGSSGSRSRTAFGIVWILVNLLLLSLAWTGLGPVAKFAAAVFVMPAVNVWCLIVYHSLQPDVR